MSVLAGIPLHHCTALAISDARGRVIFASSKCDHITHPTPIALAESSMADRLLQAGRSGLQMSSCSGTVIPRWRTSSSSRVGVSKASMLRFVPQTVCCPYSTLNLQRPSFSTRRCTDLEQPSAAYHICYVTSRLLLSLEDILLRTLLPVTMMSCPRSDTVIYRHVNRFYLLTYLSDEIRR